MERLRPRGWLLFAAAGLAVGGVVVGGGALRFRERRAEKARLMQELKESEQRLIRKEAVLARAGSDRDFLELQARRQLGVLRSDEIEFRFTAPPESPPRE